MIACDLDLFSRYIQAVYLLRPKVRNIFFDNPNKCKALDFYDSLMEQYAKKQKALEIKSAYDGCYEVLNYMVTTAKTRSEPLIKKLRNNSISIDDIKMTDLPGLITTLSAGLAVTRVKDD